MALKRKSIVVVLCIASGGIASTLFGLKCQVETKYEHFNENERVYVTYIEF